MNYSDLPLIIPILAAGYLLTIYLLLVLAQRNSQESPGSEAPGVSKTLYEKEVLVTQNVSEASGMR
ncbi:MAG: hypothetical protein JO235_24005 [Chroococcidiopsidaceae cyanobacterium CP_BM_RX_35]|nr:hypothetical protein [Chroococcidiopsidaceae cyanobacterium CP_BM_RX_35]